MWCEYVYCIVMHYYLRKSYIKLLVNGNGWVPFLSWRSAMAYQRPLKWSGATNNEKNENRSSCGIALRKLHPHNCLIHRIKVIFQLAQSSFEFSSNRKFTLSKCSTILRFQCPCQTPRGDVCKVWKNWFKWRPILAKYTLKRSKTCLLAYEHARAYRQHLCWNKVKAWLEFQWISVWIHSIVSRNSVLISTIIILPSSRVIVNSYAIDHRLMVIQYSMHIELFPRTLLKKKNNTNYSMDILFGTQNKALPVDYRTT